MSLYYIGNDDFGNEVVVITKATRYQPIIKNTHTCIRMYKNTHVYTCAHAHKHKDTPPELSPQCHHASGNLLQRNIPLANRIQG